MWIYDNDDYDDDDDYNDYNDYDDYDDYNEVIVMSLSVTWLGHYPF